MWQTLDHPNILALYGITLGFGPGDTMGMVSPWLDNGTLSTYLERSGDTLTICDRLHIVRPIHIPYRHISDTSSLSDVQLCEVADALAYRE